MVQKFASVEARGDDTLVIKTRLPYPLLPNDMSRMGMLWSGIVPHGPITLDLKNGCGVTGPWPTVADFNGGKSAIGTGPYTLKSYVKGSAIELTRNEGYWGDKPAWGEVKLIPSPSAGPRLTGLLAGDFDLIENPAARDVKRISETPGFGYVITPSVRVVYFQFDVARSPSPTVKAADGKNPLQDVRVRRAISMAIDRKAIAARIMDGAATPANQFLPDGIGTLPRPPELKYDPEAAKKLLAEAGYPNGFELAVSSTNDRYINDAQISQAVAQYLSRVGIKASVDAMTRSIYFPSAPNASSASPWAAGRRKRAKPRLSCNTGSPRSTRSTAWAPATTAATTTRRSTRSSSAPWSRWTRPRAKLLQESLAIALADLPSIPLHFESSIWRTARA